jgi:hypothetical protein
MSRVLLVFLLALLPACAQEYWNRLTGTFGALNPAGGYQTNDFGSSPMLSFDYGYRFHRYAQADVGVDIAFATETLSQPTVTSTRRNIYIPRFGYRAVIPLRQDRIEASIGAGGAYTFYKPTIVGREMWMVYGQIGANYALDIEKRYRAGLMVRWYRDPIGSPVQQWVSVGAEFTFSAGR